MVSLTKSFYRVQLKIIFRKIFYFLIISLLISSFSLSQEPIINSDTLETLLVSLATRADNFERSLPDFITTETLTQESLEKKDNKLLDRNITVSRLTGRQLQITKKGSTQLDFQEIRQVQSINGKTVKVDRFKSRGPQVDGVFSSILLSHFASLDQNDFNFSLDSQIHNLRNRPSYLIKFVSRPKVSERQYYFFEGKRLISRQEGQAWIDKETLAPLRIEYKEINLAKNIESITYSVDYSTVLLGEDTFLLPIQATSEIQEKKVINRVFQEYSDYKKFSTDIKFE
ncbi:MAG: hypothetical protein HY819_05200 [Acidobacteria bacterium]|nr:hypothetical protein [Acidobacteriota bacterium]